MKRDLPTYIYRKRGVLFFEKRVGTGKIVRKLETQFPEGAKVPDALYDERKRLLDNPRPAPTRRTWAALIAYYRKSPKYRKLALRTVQDYDKVMDFLAERLEGLDPAKMERPHVIRLRDANAAKMRFANYCVQVVRILQEVCIDLGWRPSGSNPAKGVPLLKSDRPDREPWPLEKIEAFRAAFTYGTPERLLFEMLLGTGQRIGDVLKARWNDLDGDCIHVVQGKTGSKLVVPMTEALSTSLSASERLSVFICPNPHSRGQWTYFRAADTMRKARKAIGAEAWDLHSLRYTATAELARVGCTDDEIAAITGHKSKAMIAKYAGPARQIARARKARERNRDGT